jgi:hypothetical protein
MLIDVVFLISGTMILVQPLLLCLFRPWATRPVSRAPKRFGENCQPLIEASEEFGPTAFANALY